LNVRRFVGAGVGDEVVLLGPQGNDRITLSELMAWLGDPKMESAMEILYSLLARNPKRVVRGVASELHPRHLLCGLCLDV
jgi:hypothetical protein